MPACRGSVKRSTTLQCSGIDVDSRDSQQELYNLSLSVFCCNIERTFAVRVGDINIYTRNR